MTAVLSRPGRQIYARPRLDRGAADRRRDRLDRCGGGVLPDPRRRPASAPRVGATLEVESGTNDPFAIFLTIVLVEILMVGHRPRGRRGVADLASSSCSARSMGVVGGRLIVLGAQPPGSAAGPARAVRRDRRARDLRRRRSSCTRPAFSRSISAGLVVGNRPTRAHNTVVAFLDAATWLAQIVMFVLLGLLVWPGRLGSTLLAGERRSRWC